MTKRGSLWMTLGAAVAPAAGCGGGSSGPGDGGNTDVSLAGDVQPIFTSTCATANCHGVAESAGLTLW
jgi:hypothetical protein